ncbi:MAG: SDR family NAD(P)-dependent oxidoreductase [Pseudomonadota bacterium]
MNVLITGNSSGLGLGLTKQLLARDAIVWGMSRRGCPLQDEGLRDRKHDLANLTTLPEALERLLSDCLRLDLVILNAGILGRIQPISETHMAELEHLMRINVWANKVILDWLIERQLPATQIVAISSGAGHNLSYGWGGYALSKSLLNDLIALYAHEMSDSHLTALAPGLVDTGMQDYLCEHVDTEEYPSVQKLVNARGSEAMPDPDQAATRILDLMEKLNKGPSGQFTDLRNV